MERVTGGTEEETAIPLQGRKVATWHLKNQRKESSRKMEDSILGPVQQCGCPSLVTTQMPTPSEERRNECVQA